MAPQILKFAQYSKSKGVSGTRIIRQGPSQGDFQCVQVNMCIRRGSSCSEPLKVQEIPFLSLWRASRDSRFLSPLTAHPVGSIAFWNATLSYIIRDGKKATSQGSWVCWQRLHSAWHSAGACPSFGPLSSLLLRFHVSFKPQVCQQTVITDKKELFWTFPLA